MRKTFYLLLWLGVSALPYGVQADESIELGMVTGDQAGTYYQFGQDMSKLVAQHGITLEVLPSRGSIENMLAIFDSRSIQLGIAQSDVTLFMNLLGDAKTKDIAREIKVIFPLYDEEVHLLANQDIKQLSDLDGKKVAIDRPGSGTAMTASLIFEIAKVKPAERLDIGEQTAVEALRKGEIDAMFYVVGHPAKLFQETVSGDDKFHLVPVADKSVRDIFGTTSKIPASAYSWQDEEVETVSVKAGLMTLDYKGDNVNCGYVERFAKTIRDNLDWLKQNGHEKWKSVDVDAPVHPSLQSACAVRGAEKS